MSVSRHLSLRSAEREMTANGGELDTMESEVYGARLRLEGKDYIVKDGDVLNFRFNT